MMRWVAAVLAGTLLGWASVATAVEPTLKRPPTYWSCQGRARTRVVVTFLDTSPATAILERDGQRLIAKQGKSASGAKYIASDGAFFWVKGTTAILEWPVGTPSSCVSLD